MSDIIQLLPDSVANQIAAGEVIQRPASIIKELVENSLDAGASHIQVVVEDAGKTLVQVIDNGSGMSATDARLSFERHATSKIKKATDLFALRTMGHSTDCCIHAGSITTRCKNADTSNFTHILTFLKIEIFRVIIFIRKFFTSRLTVQQTQEFRQKNQQIS